MGENHMDNMLENIEEMEFQELGSEDFAADFEEEAKQNEDWPESWQQENINKISLRHLGKTYEIEPEEAKNLAQKGMDYDRIRSERDSMRPKIQQLEGLLSALSRHSGMDQEELLHQAQAENLQRQAEEQGENLSYEEALARAEDFSFENSEELRRRESLLEFSRRFPDVKPENVPESVWEDFFAGGELSSLYALEENARLSARIRQLEQRERNHFRSTGSRRSAGERSGSALEDIWNSGD